MVRNALSAIGPVSRSVLISVFWFSFASCSGPGVDLVLRGGRVLTFDGAQPWAEALAVEGDAVRAVGSDTDMDRFIGRETVVIELDGRLVLPGFHDSHIDLMRGSTRLDWARLAEAGSVADILDIVQAYANAHPDRRWILGSGWIPDRTGSVTREELDRVVFERPVFLEAGEGDVAWVNSKALEISRTQEASGVLLGEDAVARVRDALPKPNRVQRRELLRRGIRYTHRFGITSIETSGGISDPIELYEELERRGELGLRVLYVATVSRETTEHEIDEIVQWKHRFRGPWLRAGAARIELDGPLGSGSHSLLAPSVCGATGEAQDDLDSLVEKLDQSGLQIILAAHTEPAIRMALGALEKQRSKERRHRIEGAEIVSHQDMSRFASLGIPVSVAPFRASPDFMGLWAPRVGSRLAERAFAWKTLLRSGTRLVFGTGWPRSDVDPLLGIGTAVTRENLDGQPEGGWTPGERLSLEEALRAYTYDGAYISFEEDRRGSLEAGKWADLTVLTEDPFKIPPHRIAEVEAAMTMVGGRVVWVSPSFLPEPMRRMLLETPLREPSP